MSEAAADDADATTLGLAEASRFQRDLYLYWQIAQQGLPLTTRGFVTLPTLRRVRAYLAAASPEAATPTNASEADDGRLYFLRRFAERMDLLRETPDGSHLVAVVPAAAAQHFALPLAARLALAANLWAREGWWPEPHEIRNARPPLDAPPGTRTQMARLRLLRALSEVPAGALCPKAAPESATATLKGAWHHWLCGPLAWLGIVVPEGDDVVRAGAAITVLRQSPPRELPEAAGRVVVQPDFSVVAYPPLTAGTLLALDTCATRDALDRLARYRLDARGSMRAANAGWDAARIIQTLESLSGSALPSAVATTLRDWQRQAERLRATPRACLLEVPHERLLDALLVAPGASGWVERRLSPTAALLRPEALSQVRIWLLRQGEVARFQPAPTAE